MNIGSNPLVSRYGASHFRVWIVNSCWNLNHLPGLRSSAFGRGPPSLGVDVQNWKFCHSKVESDSHQERSKVS